MFRTFVILGVLLDVLLALFLLLVFGWVMDSWHDPKGAWVGITVTTVWLIAFRLCGGAPALGYLLHRRRSSPARLALAVWLPAVVIVGVSVVGLMISPP